MYTVEWIPVAELPDCPEHDPPGIAAAVALRDSGSAPPPIVVVRSRIVRSGQPATSYAIYDGMRRITAAKRQAAGTIEAAVCKTTAAAEGLRARIQQAGGAVKFWKAERASRLMPQPSSL